MPDHNTLCRAFKVILNDSCIGRLLDLLARWMGLAKAMGTVCAVDSTLYDTHHRSRHYEQRCRHYSSRDKNTANFRRSRSALHAPKLSLSIDVRSRISSWQRGHAQGWDLMRDFLPLLRAGAKFVGVRLGTVLADAGYDSPREPPGGPDGGEGTFADQGREWPARQQAADIEVSPHDAKKVERIAERQTIRPARPGGNGQQHDETQPWSSSG